MPTTEIKAEADRAYSIKEAAERMGGVCTRTVYNEAERGRLTLKKIGRRTVVPAVALAAYVANLPDVPVGSAA